MTEMTVSQMRAMIEFHRKMEKAFAQYGKPADAEAAKIHREQLEKKLAVSTKGS